MLILHNTRSLVLPTLRRLILVGRLALIMGRLFVYKVVLWCRKSFLRSRGLVGRLVLLRIVERLLVLMKRLRLPSGRVFGFRNSVLFPLVALLTGLTLFFRFVLLRKNNKNLRTQAEPSAKHKPRATPEGRLRLA